MASPRVDRIRPLTTTQVARIELLRRVARFLDSAVTVPGTSYRVGLDPVLGLIPGLGDLISPLFGVGIMWQAYDLGVPKIVQVRMLFNVAIDAIVGAVPLFGDLFDFVWKANVRNLALLDRHAEQGYRASAGDWVFVLALTLAVIAVAAIPFVVVGWALAMVGGRLF